jgi:hypothetical protein
MKYGLLLNGSIEKYGTLKQLLVYIYWMVGKEKIQIVNQKNGRHWDIKDHLDYNNLYDYMEDKKNNF